MDLFLLVFGCPASKGFGVSSRWPKALCLSGYCSLSGKMCTNVEVSEVGKQFEAGNIVDVVASVFDLCYPFLFLFESLLKTKEVFHLLFG